MSEWFSVLAVFWALWAVDGLRLLPLRAFTLIGGIGDGWTRRFKRKEAANATPSPRSSPRAQPERNLAQTPAARGVQPSRAGSGRARVSYARLSLPGWLPLSWRMNVSDVPLALSPLGICNVSVGAAGRPTERPGAVRCWRWEEVRHVGVAQGWIFVNGERFCAATGHVEATELLALAKSDPSRREKRIEALIQLWFRPTHLRRRAFVLKGRSALPAWLNAITFVGFIGLTVYLVGDIASRLSLAWSERLAAIVPWLLLGILVLHLSAVVLAWKAKRRLRAVVSEKRSAALFSALLLPPQAFRLRSLLGDGYFPAQHPLSAILAFGSRRSTNEHAFNTVADLRWPVGELNASSPMGVIVTWFRSRLETVVLEQLNRADTPIETLVGPPQPDSPISCSYCPRCRAQFVDRRPICPNRVILQPLTRPGRPGTGET